MTVSEFKKLERYRPHDCRKCGNCGWRRDVTKFNGPEEATHSECTAFEKPFTVFKTDVCDMWNVDGKGKAKHA